jgi:hypothetical protein
VQQDPVLAELNEQGCGRDGKHEGDQQHRDAVGDDRREHDKRHKHQQTEMLRIPAPGQREPAPADHSRDPQAEGRGHPVVDRRDGDDVHVRRGNAGRRQRDCADPAAGAGVQPSRYGNQSPGEQSARTDADLGPQDACLRGEDEEQNDADQRDRNTGDGQHLADPVRVTRRR